ncbi:hypothetical protein IAQ61_003957 [Plenodomus lingam]|uniref:RING-type domain-containing protein n=1 Tax=Leptosphaeria maculans (strain JN3 / isolate v23.1.3 / race Av1-4-5-6-7-8) TaxID=985895 RepID=E4ZQT1_LEPMJ|nr:hypothetical protein LEMA_P037600.1 [Plenodomus lingam JN3]KAH9874767.1 hypothetical protein IAQ61_003957 [Plenodomus lingam]CBX94086.1 hypothetical protein LEMA_P037600.1 [Plenodomus lingam JN3]
MSSMIPAPDVGVEIPRLELNNGLCCIWATLALARLDQAGDIAPGFGLQFRTTLHYLYERVGNYSNLHHWDDVPLTNAHRELLKDSAMALVNHPSASQRQKQEFAYLWAIVDQFMEKLSLQTIHYPSGPLGDYPFGTQLVVKLRNLTGDIISQFLTEVDVQMDQLDEVGELQTVTTIRQEIGAYAAWIQTDLEDYIHKQTSLKVLGDNDPDGLTGDSFISLMRAGEEENSSTSLLTCIRMALIKITDGVFSVRRRDIRSREVILDSLCWTFYRGVAEYFSFYSPLLNRHHEVPSALIDSVPLFDDRFPLPGSLFGGEFYDGEFEDEDDMDVDDHDEDDQDDEDEDDQDDDDEDDEDGQFPEYEPDEYGNDILTGPENVQVTDVSQRCLFPRDQTCAICGEAQNQIRTINICGHEVCANCLQQQLDSAYNSRYRCAFCRAEFFTNDDA